MNAKRNQIVHAWWAKGEGIDPEMLRVKSNGFKGQSVSSISMSVENIKSIAEEIENITKDLQVLIRKYNNVYYKLDIT